MKRLIGIATALALACVSSAATAGGGYHDNNDEAWIGALIGGVLGFALGSTTH